MKMMEKSINQIQRDVRWIIKEESEIVQEIRKEAERLWTETKEEIKTEKERKDVDE